MAPTNEEIVSVGHIEPKKVHNTPSSPLPSNVSFAKADHINVIDFNPSTDKKTFASPVKVPREDPRFYEEREHLSKSGKKYYTDYHNLNKPNKHGYDNIAAFAVPEFNA